MTLHLEESPLCHPSYADSVPGSVITEALEKPDEACSSSQASRSPSPQIQDHGFLLETMGRVERPRSGQVLGLGFGLRAAYKTDLYSSDTALYCAEERQRERQAERGPAGAGDGSCYYRPQNSTDSNPEEDGGPPRVRPPRGPPSPRSTASSASPCRPRAPTPASAWRARTRRATRARSAAPSPRSHQQALYMEWRDAGDYERKSTSSYEKDSPSGSFPKSSAHPFQQPELSHHQHQHHQHHQHHQNGSVPSLQFGPCRPVSANPTSSLPPRLLAAVWPTGTAAAVAPWRPGEVEVQEEEEEDLSGRWRQLSVEDINAYSYRNPGRISPYSFSEQHFTVRSIQDQAWARSTAASRRGPTTTTNRGRRTRFGVAAAAAAGAPARSAAPG